MGHYAGEPGMPAWADSVDAAVAIIPVAYAHRTVATGSGVDPSGTTDSTAGIQACLDGSESAGGGLVELLPGTYVVSGLRLPPNVGLMGMNSGSQAGASTTLLYSGASGGSIVGPKYRTGNNANVTVAGLALNGNGSAGIGVDMFQTSYSRLESLSIYGLQASGVGVLFDASTSMQCYFNTADGVKVGGGGVSGVVGARFQNGANANRWSGGVMISLATGMEFLSLSGFNVVIGTDFETQSVKHVYMDAPSNVFLGVHMEGAPIGYDATAKANDWREFGTTASSLTTFVQDASAFSARVGQVSASAYRAQLGYSSILSTSFSTATTVDVDPKTATGTASAVLNMFRSVSTSGTRQFNIYKGDGTSTVRFSVDPSTGNVVAAGSLNLGSAGTIAYNSSAPASGTWATGSRIFNSSPAVGQPKGWICTAGGTPGTWVSEGSL